jgi:phytoene dehydrogenase-like protein
MPDLIVVGSGLGGLCAAAIACRHGLEVLVLEAHSQPGGAAHGFRRGPFHFESGPSLWSGLGRWPSANPLAQVLRAVDESVPVARYSEWGLLLPEGNLRVGVGLEPFLELLRSLRGPAVAAEWQAFLMALAPLCRVHHPGQPGIRADWSGGPAGGPGRRLRADRPPPPDGSLPAPLGRDAVFLDLRIGAGSDQRRRHGHPVWRMV